MKKVVFTETSVYYLDEEEKTVTRVPGFGKGPDPDMKTKPLLEVLRRDCEPLHLYEVLVLEKGRPLEMFIQIRDDGVQTFRRTTNVREIVEVS